MHQMNVAPYSSYRIATRYGTEVGVLAWNNDGQVVDYARRILRTDLNAPLIVTRLASNGAYVEVGRVD